MSETAISSIYSSAAEAVLSRVGCGELCRAVHGRTHARIMDPKAGAGRPYCNYKNYFGESDGPPQKAMGYVSEF